MKWSDISQKTPDELRQLHQEFCKEQLNLRFQRAAGQLENTARIRTVRRAIARIHTRLNQNPSAQKP